MKTLGSILAVALVVSLGSPALADDDTVIDLTVKHIPVEVTSLAIRSANAAASAISEPAASAPAVIGPSIIGGASAEAEVSGDFSPLPTSMRDIEERVQFKVNVGYAVDGAGLSGDIGKGGFAPGDITDPDGNQFTETRQALIGDAVIGTRGILLPTLNTYFLSRYQLDFDGASQFASLNNVYDSGDGRDILVHAAYAEVDGLDSIGVKGAYLRGGRQFRYGGSMFVTRFDGITAGYNDPAIEATGFFGRRASVFFNDDPGLVGGGGIKLRLKELANVPLDLSADYLFYDGGGDGELALNADFDGDGQNDVLNLAKNYFELGAKTWFGNSRITAHVRLADKGERVEFGELQEAGFALASIGVRLRQVITRKILLVADVEQRFEDDLSYDYINPSPVDVINVSQQLGIGIDPPEQSTRIGARINAMVTREVELWGFGRINISGDEKLSGFHRPWQEFGIAASARAARRVTVMGQYKLRLTTLDDDANGVETLFDDTSGSGVNNFQELSAEARYSMGYKKVTVGVGGYFRVYSLQSPYTEVENDARAGGRAMLDYFFSKMTGVKLEGEVAQPSPTFSPEISTLVAFRAMMEVLF